MTTNEIAEAVQKHAVVNYENSGWDYIVECWTRDEIEGRLKEHKITTLEDALDLYSKIAKIFDGRRKEAEAEIF